MQIRFAALALMCLFAGLFAFTLDTPADAATTLPTKMNFQGRITNASGTILANGTYNMRFRIWNAASGGATQWTEDRLVSAAQGVTVTNGQFTVQLGSVTALNASVFTSSSLYFEVELPTPATATSSSPSWTEGAMTPRNQLATSAYAYNAETLDGIDGAAFAQMGQANAFTGNNTFSGTSGFTNTVDVNVSSTAAFQVRNGSTNLFSVNTSGSQITLGTADTTGMVLVLDSKTNTGDTTGTNGAMYYNSNSNKFRCYQAGAWADCIAAGGSTTLQNAYDNSGSPATITTTAAKGINITAGAVPTADLFNVSNAGQGVTTAGVNGIGVNFVGGAAAIESSGIRVDLTPGGTSGGTWSGFRVVANATGAASGVNENGITIDGPSSPGAGTEKGLEVGTGWDIGVDIQSGGIQLAANSDPAAPATGNLKVYAKDIAGRVMPKWIGPSGVDTPFQAGLGFNRVSMMMPAGGSTLTTFVGGFGSTFTNVGTAANPTPTSTSHLSSVRRATFSTGTTAGAMTSHRQSVLQVWRGNAANRGGFFYTIRFGTSTLAAGNRMFVGLSDSTAAPTNIDPLATGTGIGRLGVAINSNTGNWNFVNNVSGTAPTVTALGANFPVNTTDIYELVLFSPPNGSSVGYRVQNITTGNQTSGSVSTNIPANTTFMSPNFWATNNATGAAAIIDFTGWYLESDN